MKCQRSGRVCAGYYDDGTFQFRDMTAETSSKYVVGEVTAGGKAVIPAPATLLTIDASSLELYTPANPGLVLVASSSSSSSRPLPGSRRASKRSRASTSGASSKAESPQSETDGGGDPKRPRPRRQTLNGLPRALELPTEFQASTYFANRYASIASYSMDPGYAAVFRLVAGNVNPSPCLSSGLNAVALALFFKASNNWATSAFQAWLAYTRATEEMVQAMQQPDSTNNDDVLASVVLLSFFEVSLHHFPVHGPGLRLTLCW